MNDIINNTVTFAQQHIGCCACDLEKSMWDAALNRDSAAFLRLVAEDAVMLCGGARLTGAQYAQLVSGYGISAYELSEFRLLRSTETLIQVHYIVRTTADCPENADLAGIFRVTSTWEKQENGWRLIFNMDQRIYL